MKKNRQFIKIIFFGCILLVACLFEMIKFRYLIKNFNLITVSLFQTITMIFCVWIFAINDSLSKIKNRIFTDSVEITTIYIILVLIFKIRFNIDFKDTVLIVIWCINTIILNKMNNTTSIFYDNKIELFKKIQYLILSISYILQLVFIVFFKNVLYFSIYMFANLVLQSIVLHFLTKEHKNDKCEIIKNDVSIIKATNYNYLKLLVTILLTIIASISNINQNLAFSMYFIIYTLISKYINYVLINLNVDNNSKFCVLNSMYMLLGLLLSKLLHLCFASRFNISFDENIFFSIFLLLATYISMNKEFYNQKRKLNIINMIIAFFIIILLYYHFGLSGFLIGCILPQIVILYINRKNGTLLSKMNIVICILNWAIMYILTKILSFSNIKVFCISSLIIIALECILVFTAFIILNNRTIKNKKKSKMMILVIKIFTFIGLTVTLFLILIDLKYIYNKYKESKEPYVNVLAYHHFVSKEDKEKYYKDNEYVLSIEDFEEQLKWLKNNDYIPINTQDLYDWLNGTKKLDKKSILITIDDGNISTYYLALPLIEKYDFKAVAFIITSRVGEKTQEWDSTKTQFLGKDILKDILENHPNLELGSHSYALHGRVNNLAPKDLSVSEISNDVSKSKDILDTDLYCYPFGGVSDNYIKALKENNYKMAFVFGESKKTRITDDLYKISRITITGSTDMKEFKKKLQ